MSKNIHAIATRGYTQAAESYERGRPEYPVDAVNHLVSALALDASKTVLEVGAGTGKFTRLLAPLGARIIAVEPVAEMRRKCASILPQIGLLDGTAEEVPLADSSVDAVVAAQAFHWFRGAEALAEFHRVLRPGGRLGLIWNRRDESIDWVARLEEIIGRHEQEGVPRYKSGEWLNVFAVPKNFGPLRHARFDYVQKGTIETVTERVASVSFIAALPDNYRAQVLAEVRTLINEHPATRGKEAIEIPYSTDVFVADRI